MIICPYCGKEISITEIVKLIKCKYRLEEDDSIDDILGEPFVTMRHGKCFPFGIRYNKKAGRFKVEK